MKAAQYFAECLISTPFFISKHTGEPAAEISSIIIQTGIFICELHVSCTYLEENFDDIDFVYKHYLEVDFSYIFNIQ